MDEFTEAKLRQAIQQLLEPLEMHIVYPGAREHLKKGLTQKYRAWVSHLNSSLNQLPFENLSEVIWLLSYMLLAVVAAHGMFTPVTRREGGSGREEEGA